MIGTQEEFPGPHSDVKAKVTGKETFHNSSAHLNHKRTEICVDLCKTRKRLYSSKYYSV